MNAQRLGGALFAAASIAMAPSCVHAADGGEARIAAMLKAHPVVTAAARQAQDFAGSRSCRYAVARAVPVPQFEPGSAFDFEAEIVCRRGDVAGIVKVSGRYVTGQGAQQELRLEIGFAG